MGAVRGGLPAAYGVASAVDLLPLVFFSPTLALADAIPGHATGRAKRACRSGKMASRGFMIQGVCCRTHSALRRHFLQERAAVKHARYERTRIGRQIGIGRRIGRQMGSLAIAIIVHLSGVEQVQQYAILRHDLLRKQTSSDPKGHRMRHLRDTANEILSLERPHR